MAERKILDGPWVRQAYNFTADEIEAEIERVRNLPRKTLAELERESAVERLRLQQVIAGLKGLSREGGDG